MVLRNHYCVVLFGGIKLKRAFYLRFFANASDLIIFECSKSLPRNSGTIKDSIVINCESHLQLLDELRAIPQDKNIHVSARYLNTIVIESISSFYWDLRCEKSSDRVLWYKQINQILTTIKDTYKCNILVTGWDNDYERGFNNKGSKSRQFYNLDDVSFMPKELFRGAKFIFAYQTGRSLVYETLWRQILPEQPRGKKPRLEATGAQGRA